MKEILKKTSTNGRWGISIVSPTEDLDFNSPVQGELKSLGTFEGCETYKLTPSNSGVWYYVGEDVTIVAGATIVTQISLQSSNFVTIVALGNFGIIKTFGYKGRSSKIQAFQNGVSINLPVSVLAAMGLIPTPNAKPITPEIPALSGVLAEALKKAGLH